MHIETYISTVIKLVNSNQIERANNILKRVNGKNKDSFILEYLHTVDFKLISDDIKGIIFLLDCLESSNRTDFLFYLGDFLDDYHLSSSTPVGKIIKNYRNEMMSVEIW